MTWDMPEMHDSGGIEAPAEQEDCRAIGSHSVHSHKLMFLYFINNHEVNGYGLRSLSSRKRLTRINSRAKCIVNDDGTDTTNERYSDREKFVSCATKHRILRPPARSPHPGTVSP